MRGRWPLPPLVCRRSALHPGDFLVRRKSPKTHQEPPGSWTSGEGGLAPFDPPALCPSGIGGGGTGSAASSEHMQQLPIGARKRTLETKGKTLFYILYSINLFLIEIVVFRFQEADKWRS